MTSRHHDFIILGNWIDRERKSPRKLAVARIVFNKCSGIGYISGLNHQGDLQAIGTKQNLQVSSSFMSMHHLRIIESVGPVLAFEEKVVSHRRCRSPRSETNNTGPAFSGTGWPGGSLLFFFFSGSFPCA